MFYRKLSMVDLVMLQSYKDMAAALAAALEARAGAAPHPDDGLEGKPTSFVLNALLVTAYEAGRVEGGGVRVPAPPALYAGTLDLQALMDAEFEARRNVLH